LTLWWWVEAERCFWLEGGKSLDVGVGCLVEVKTDQGFVPEILRVPWMEAVTSTKCVTLKLCSFALCAMVMLMKISGSFVQ
jgi:hypothetical protein